jgi:hypothetical protein
VKEKSTAGIQMQQIQAGRGKTPEIYRKKKTLPQAFMKKNLPLHPYLATDFITCKKI